MTWLEHKLELRLEPRLELRLEPWLEPRLEPSTSDDELIKDQPHKCCARPRELGSRLQHRCQKLQMMAKIIARHKTARLDSVHGARRARHYTTIDADNSGVEKIPHAGNMRSATSVFRSSAHGAIGQAAKAGSQHSPK